MERVRQLRAVRHGLLHEPDEHPGSKVAQLRLLQEVGPCARSTKGLGVDVCPGPPFPDCLAHMQRNLAHAMTQAHP